MRTSVVREARRRVMTIIHANPQLTAIEVSDNLRFLSARKGWPKPVESVRESLRGLAADGYVEVAGHRSGSELWQLTPKGVAVISLGPPSGKPLPDVVPVVKKFGVA